MRVRNRTGVTQVAPRGSYLLPGVWLDVPGEVSYVDAVWMSTMRMADLADIQDAENLLWKSQEGTHLYWLSPFSLGDGYATAAENLVHALKGQGCQIEVHQCWFLSKDGLQTETLEMLNEGAATTLHRVGLCMATPGEFKKLPTPYRIGLTMYESDSPLVNLPEWKHDCGDVDLLVVPCEYCKDVFEQFVHVPVKVAPLAINPIYHTERLRKPKDTFTFVSFGTLSGRKSPLETLDAFKKAFPLDKYPNVRIEFKTRLGMFGWGQNQLPDIVDPRVSIITEDWYRDQMLDWLHAADAMVFASKGEGFGMPPREAIATGLPTILTDNTGMKPMCDPRYTFPIPVGKVEDSPLGGNWYVPDWDALIETMRWIYDHREEAAKKGWKASKWFALKHGPEVVGQHLLDIIEGVDPTESATRHNRIPAAPKQTTEEHIEFFDWIETQVKPPGPVWVMGISEGLLYKELIHRGYIVVGVVAPEDEARARSKLLTQGIDTPQLLIRHRGLLDAPVLRREGYTMPLACISMGILQQLGNDEIVKAIQNQLSVTSQVLFSVPSVYYPSFYQEHARLLRRNNWTDILRDLSYSIEEYGSDDSFFRFRVYKTILARGIAQRRKGRVLQGVWHPNN